MKEYNCGAILMKSIIKLKTILIAPLLVMGFMLLAGKALADDNVNKQDLSADIFNSISAQYKVNDNVNVSEIKSITISSNDNVSLKGISKLTELQKITIKAKGILYSDEMKSLKKLTHLYLELNGAEYLSVETYNKLKVLRIKSASLKTVDASKPVYIKNFTVDLSRLKKIKRNKTVHCLKIDNLNNYNKNLKRIKRIDIAKFEYKKHKTIKLDKVNTFKKLEIKFLKSNKIKINKCNRLNDVYISDVKSKEIKIQNCKKLKRINVGTDQIIKKLIVQNNNKLEKLLTGWSSGFNKVRKVKIKKLKSLKRLDLSSSTIRRIDLSKFPKLRYVNLSECKIKKIKIGKKNRIHEIDLSHNKIRKVNIRFLKKAYKIDLSNNRISGCLLLPKMIREDANTIYCDNNMIKHIKSPKNSNIWILSCNKNKLKTIDLNNAELNILECKNNPRVKVYYASINRKRGGKSTKYIKKYKERD